MMSTDVRSYREEEEEEKQIRKTEEEEEQNSAGSSPLPSLCFSRCFCQTAHHQIQVTSGRKRLCDAIPAEPSSPARQRSPSRATQQSGRTKLASTEDLGRLGLDSEQVEERTVEHASWDWRSQTSRQQVSALSLCRMAVALDRAPRHVRRAWALVRWEAAVSTLVSLRKPRWPRPRLWAPSVARLRFRCQLVRTVHPATS